MNKVMKTDIFGVECGQKRSISADLSTISQTHGARDRLTSLSTIETEVLFLRLRNLSSEEVAERLEISQDTVESHCTDVLAKLNVETLIQALNLVDIAARLAS